MRPRPRLALGLVVLAASVLTISVPVSSAAQRPSRASAETPGATAAADVPARCRRFERDERQLQRCIKQEERRQERGGGGGGGTTTPKLTNLKIAPKAFRAATTGGSVLPVGAPATVTFSLSAPVTVVRFRVQRPIAGRLVGGRCRVQNRGNRTKPRCSHPPAVVGTFVVTPVVVGAGASNQAFGFTGRVGGKALKPGAYQLTPQLLGATRVVNQAKVAFVIRKPVRPAV